MNAVDSPARTAMPDRLVFRHYSRFAAFLLQNHLDELVREQIRVSRELDVPLLKLFTHLSDEQLIEMSKAGQRVFLASIAENHAREQINTSLQQWLNNTIQGLEREQITAADITLVSYMRKQVYLKFIPRFTSDTETMLALLSEIDAYSFESDSAGMDIYLQILHEKLNAQHRQNDRVTEALRESEALYEQAQTLAHIGNWTWDVETNIITWSDELFRIHNMEPQSVVPTFELERHYIHPEDRDSVSNVIRESLRHAQPGEVIYRLELPDGVEKIIHGKCDVQANDKGWVHRMSGTAQDVTERQRLLDRLQRSERLYKQAQAITHVGNWVWNLPDKTLTWSDEMYRIYGLEPRQEPILSETVAGFNHPDDVAYIHEQTEHNRITGEPFDFVYRIIVDGEVKVLRAIGESKRDENGTSYQTFGTVQDITAQHRVETQLRENQTFIKKLADATPSIIASYNVRTGKYTFISGGLDRLLGYSAKEAMEKGAAFFASLIHPEDLGELMEKNVAAVSRANETGLDDVAEFTYRMRHRNGTYRWMHTYGTVFDRNEKNEVEHVLNISLDISERIATEQRLRERERFIEHIADASPTLLYLFDLEQAKLLYVNQEISAVLGYSTAEVLAMGNLFTPTVYHPEDVGKSPARYLGYRQNPYGSLIPQYECRMRRKHGGWRWMLVRETVYQSDAKGEPTQILGAALDITERKELERTLVQKTLQLEQSNDSLREFAYVASHDLREPLRKIQVFADRIMQKERERLTEQGRDWFERMKTSAARMDRLIEDLLMFSRANMADRNFEPVDLNALLETVKTDLSEQIEKSEAHVLAERLPTVNGIAVQLRQLMQNLLSNAIKFRRPDAPPLIRISSDTAYGSDMQDFDADPHVVYTKLIFRDNGIGFEPEFANKIFELFQRLHGKDAYPGTGIGLALCKKVVENHNGFIKAESELGNGATFTVYLPA